LLAGILLAIPIVLHPDETADPTAVLTSSWLVIHTIFIIGDVLSIFGLIGLYTRQSQEIGSIGLIGFILAIIGSALFVGVLMIDSYVIPVLAAEITTQPLLDEAGPLFGGPLGLVFLAAGITFALGTLLTGFTTLRAAVLPRWAGLLLLIGGPLLAFTPPLPHLVGTIGGVLLGLSYIWLGYALWRNWGEQTEHAKQATPGIAPGR
jgi:hypothetical protein